MFPVCWYVVLIEIRRGGSGAAFEAMDYDYLRRFLLLELILHCRVGGGGRYVDERGACASNDARDTACFTCCLRTN